jgi:hypothetical protein
MQDLERMAQRLGRRVDVDYKSGELWITYQGEQIRVYDDAAHGRLVIWSEIADISAWDLAAAAEAAIVVNEAQAFESATTLAVSPSAGKALLGRSFEPGDLDADRLLAEIQDFRNRLLETRSLFRTVCTNAAEMERAKAPSAEPTDTLRV